MIFFFFIIAEEADAKFSQNAIPYYETNNLFWLESAF